MNPPERGPDPWATHEPGAAAPWDVRRVVHVHRRPGGPGRVRRGRRPLPFLTGSADPGSLDRVGPYEVTGVLGRGGMGWSRGPGPGRLAAVKAIAGGVGGGRPGSGSPAGPGR